jgi:hypothetical protein
MTSPQPAWMTSSFCSVGTCVSVAHTDNTVMVRHSAHPDGTVLAFSREEWVEFLSGVRAGEFDVAPAEEVQR